MQRSHYTCDRCGDTQTDDFDDEDNVPDGWLWLAEKNEEGSLSPIYHLCTACGTLFTQWMDSGNPVKADADD